jgi:hypothetical protein
VIKYIPVFSEYAERLGNYRGKLSLSTMPGDFKGTAFEKN